VPRTTPGEERRREEGEKEGRKDQDVKQFSIVKEFYRFFVFRI